MQSNHSDELAKIIGHSDEAKQLKLAIANGANDNITRPMVDKINDIVDSADKIEFKPKATLMDDVAEKVGKNADKTGKLTIIDEGIHYYSESEKNAARYMAEQGHDVTLRPPIGTRAEGNTSDLIVDGVNYDVYTPTTDKVNNIISGITHKNTQTTGVVLDLSNTKITAEDLGNVLSRVKGAIEKNGGTCNITSIIIMPK